MNGNGNLNAVYLIQTILYLQNKKSDYRTGEGLFIELGIMNANVDTLCCPELGRLALSV